MSRNSALQSRKYAACAGKMGAHVNSGPRRVNVRARGTGIEVRMPEDRTERSTYSAEVNERRFWERVIVGDGCWRWTGAKSVQGYGQFRLGGSQRSPRVMAHRFAYELFNAPLGDLLGCHTCDTPICVRPDHIFPGTHADNSADMVSKQRHRVPNRSRSGELHTRAKITDEQALEIRALRRSGVGPKAISSGYDLTMAGVISVCKRKWMDDLDGGCM